MLNRVVLVGRLTKDPEYRTTPSGVSVATFTLAVNRTFTNAQGEREADFINCVVFRRQAEKVVVFLLLKSYVIVFNSLNIKTHNKVANVHRTIISKTTVKDLVVSNQDKIHLTTTIIHQTQISRIIRLQMLMDRLISVMMIYHSNNERIK